MELRAAASAMAPCRKNPGRTDVRLRVTAQCSNGGRAPTIRVSICDGSNFWRRGAPFFICSSDAVRARLAFPFDQT